LRRDLGFWRLTFAGQEGIFKHEQGAAYVAYLLLNPPKEPIHALDLCVRAGGRGGPGNGIAELVDPVSGEVTPLTVEARLQERSLAPDDAQTMRAVLRTENQLEALLEDKSICEPVRREAERELIALYNYEGRHCQRTRDGAQKAADAVGKAIKRFYGHLAGAVEEGGRAHVSLRAFGEHIREHVLVASGRCRGPGGARRGSELAGCFLYEAPEGVVWTK
jgi:hypothetical protein